MAASPTERSPNVRIRARTSEKILKHLTVMDASQVEMSTSLRAADLARSDKRTRALVSRKIRDNIELLATLIRKMNGTDEGSARSQAILTYCALVGAIGMARAVSDEELSREILKTVAQRLKNSAP